MEDTALKFERLKQIIKSLGSVAVAFSSGVDSTFLLKVAHDVLGDRVVAVTARSLSFPKRELTEAIAFAKLHGIEHVIVDSEELDIEGFSKNPVNRCYLCKGELFVKIKEIARLKGAENVLDGSNADDAGDYRPGMQAIKEQGVKSPLKEAGLTKAEIRRLSKDMGLPTWNKQAFACLSSRFPYGEDITPEKLRMVDEAEQYLLDLGLTQVRVRCHGNLARIETDDAGFARIADDTSRLAIHDKLKKIGFTYVSLDLRGYRTGSMNETLSLTSTGTSHV